MKIVTCALLFTLLVLFNSMKLSASSGTRGSSSFGNLLEFHARELPNIPAGRYYILPNGNVYRSRGTGIILVIYNKNEKIATVRQGRAEPVTLGPGPYGQRHYSEEYPVVRLNPVPQRIPLSSLHLD